MDPIHGRGYTYTRRCDMGKTSKAQKDAVARYDAANTIFIGLKLNRKTDADLIEMLEEAENRQGLIKEALRAWKSEHESEHEAR